MCAHLRLSLRHEGNQARASLADSRANSPTPESNNSWEEGASSDPQLPSPQLTWTQQTPRHPTVNFTHLVIFKMSVSPLIWA